MTMETLLAPAAQSEDLIYQFVAAPEWGRTRHAPCFAARLSGLSVSRDQGQTWQSAYQTLALSQRLPTLAVALAPGRSRKCVVFAGYNGGVLRSLDGGVTWENMPLRLPAPAVAALAVSPDFRRDSLVFAGTLADGVFYSGDGGAHWQTGNLGLMDMNVFCLGISPAFAADQTIFAGAQSGLFCSRTGGRAWREVDLPVGYDAVISLALSPNYAEDGVLFAGTETHGLLRSADAGRHWQALGQTALSNSINQIVLAPAYPRRPRLLVLHDGSLSASDDGGATWQPLAQSAETVVAVLAPSGFEDGQPVLMGLESGQVVPLAARAARY